MDKEEFSLEDAILKINIAMNPFKVKLKKLIWFSKFSVKESVVDKFCIENRIFLAGDASHIHSVNGGQGLNTGLSDAFNLIWKLKMVLKNGAPNALLQSYEEERKPVAMSVIESSGELVRATKFSKNGTHAEDYLKIVKKRAGNITGMGIRYGKEGLIGSRIFDFKLSVNNKETRLYSLLDYSKYTLLVFGKTKFIKDTDLPVNLNLIAFNQVDQDSIYATDFSDYKNMAILIRPDSYIEKVF